MPSTVEPLWHDPFHAVKNEYKSIKIIFLMNFDPFFTQAELRKWGSWVKKKKLAKNSLP